MKLVSKFSGMFFKECSSKNIILFGSIENTLYTMLFSLSQFVSFVVSYFQWPIHIIRHDTKCCDMNVMDSLRNKTIVR